MDPVEGVLALADLYAVEKKFEQANGEYQVILINAGLTPSLPSRGSSP